MFAVIVGIICVLAIHPGDPSIKGELGSGVSDRTVNTLDAFLDLLRYIDKICSPFAPVGCGALLRDVSGNL